MPTHAPDRPGLGEAAKSVADRASAIARLELELATLELKRKLARMALGIGMLAGAAIIGVFGLMLALALAVAALALVLPVWASIAIVLGAALGLAGILAVIGLSAVKKGTPPVPEQAIEEARLTTAALRSRNGRH